MSNKRINRSIVNKIKISIILLINFCYWGKLEASHSAGGDINLKCLGGLQYEVTLNFYTDCAGVTPLNLLVGNYESNSCNDFGIMLFERKSVEEITPLCGAQISNSTCNGGTLQGFNLYVYVDTVTLPRACTDWRFYYQVRFRNAAITNINNPGNAYFYIETILDNLNAPCNNTPVFTTPLIPYICDALPFNYNHGAIDLDGDSLAYFLIIPYEFNGTNVTFIPPFTRTQPMITTGPFNLDSLSGQLTFIPNGTQIIITAIEVREYRNGQLIGSTVRDMQIVVDNCLNNPPIPSPLINLSGASQNGNTLTTCRGNTLSFSLTATDADILDSIRVINNITTTLPGATVTITGTNSTTIDVLWSVPFGTTSFHSFTITFEDNACPVKSQQSIGYNVEVDDCVLLSRGCSEFKAVWNDSKQYTELSWVMNEKGNNKGFFVERSINGYSFESIGWINAKNALNYTYIDQTIPNGGVYYYRIKQVDLDERITYICSIKAVSVSQGTSPNFVVYPNPVDETTILQIKSEKDGEYSIKIYNVLGTLIQDRTIKVKEGLNYYPIPINHLSQGAYYLFVNESDSGIGEVLSLVKGE